MQSRGLFNFFTKAADVQQTAAGTRIARGPAAKAIHQQTSAAANKAYTAEQKRRAGMTDQQRWDEDFNNHLSDQAGAGKDQYNYAFDNYSRDLDDAVARGSMTAQQAAQARQHVINGVRDKQRAFHRDYLASFNGGDYTDADRNGIRDTKIWTTHGNNGLVHFRHGDFGENTTFGGAERGYMQRDRRLAAQGQQQSAAQAAQPAQYNRQPANTQAMPTVQTTDQFGRPTTKRLVKKRNGERVQPPVFKGGHTVNVDPGAIDWSDRGGNSDVLGMRLTRDQYAMYNNIRSQLAGSIAMQGGVDPQTARDQASMLAAQYIGDQINIANGGKAFNSWQHAEPQPTPQVTPQPEPQPTSQVTPQSESLGTPVEQQVAPQPESPEAPVEQQQVTSQPDGAAEQQPLVRTISDRDIAKRFGSDNFTLNNYITSHRQNAYNNMLRLYKQFGQLHAAGGDVSELAALEARIREQAQLYAHLKDQGTSLYGDKAMSEANKAYWSTDNMKRRAARYDADDIAKWVNLPGYVFK